MAETLVDPDWLWSHRDASDVLAVGCSYEGFLLGHIPGAVLPVHAWLKEGQFGPGLIPTEQFVRAMESLGVTERTTIVAYDDFDGTLSARLWWVLRYHGHDNVRVLDGGWHRWVVERFSLSQELRDLGEGHFVSHPRPHVACSTEGLLAQLKAGSVTVVDTRPRDEWEGTDSNLFGNKRQGRIPGALHFDVRTLFTEELRTLRSTDEIQSLLTSAGLAQSGPVIFYCQVGVAAALGALALHLLGRDDSVVYEASMADWANRDDTPLERHPTDLNSR